MADLSKMSTEELMKLANPDLSNATNSELFKVANIEPTENNLGLNTKAKKILPTFLTGAKPLPGERTVLGDIFERPGAAIREGIRSTVSGEGFGKGFKSGAINPERSETFQDQFIRESQNVGGPSESVAVNFLKGLPGSIVGLGADIVTNPADVLVDTLTLGAARSLKGGKRAIESSKKMAKAVDKPITKSIRPSVIGRKTSTQNKIAKENARIAVDTIADNKNALKLVDEGGNVKKGQLPENLNDFSQAITQTKSNVFDAYTALKKEAGEKLNVIFLDDIAEEIRRGVSNVPIHDLSPSTVKTADTLADTLKQRGFYSLDEANDAVELLNKQLKAFYRNPDPRMVEDNAVKALVANRLRKKLDNIISTETGKKFSNLKRRYGALKSIEDDVNRRMVVNSRRNNRGLVDFFDIFSGQQLAEGVLFSNPSSTARGVAGLGIKGLIKRANDPDRIIKNMFKDIEKIKTPKTIIRSATESSQTTLPASIRSLQKERKEINSVR